MSRKNVKFFLLYIIRISIYNQNKKFNFNNKYSKLLMNNNMKTME